MDEKISPISLAYHGEYILQNYFFKRKSPSACFKGFVKRYFTLNLNTLTISYKQTIHSNTKLSLPILNVISYCQSPSTPSRFPYGISIHWNARSFELFQKSLEIHTQWMIALQAVEPIRHCNSCDVYTQFKIHCSQPSRPTNLLDKTPHFGNNQTENVNKKFTSCKKGASSVATIQISKNTIDMNEMAHSNKDYHLRVIENKQCFNEESKILHNKSIQLASKYIPLSNLIEHTSINQNAITDDGTKDSKKELLDPFSGFDCIFKPTPIAKAKIKKKIDKMIRIADTRKWSSLKEISFKTFQKSREFDYDWDKS